VEPRIAALLIWRTLSMDRRSLTGIEHILAVGAQRARPEAVELMTRVRKAIGREPSPSWKRNLTAGCGRF